MDSQIRTKLQLQTAAFSYPQTKMGGQSSKLRSSSSSSSNTFLMAQDSLELAKLNPEQLEKFRREKQQQTLRQPHSRRHRRRHSRQTNGGHQRLLRKQTSHDTFDLDESTSEHDQDWRMVLWTTRSRSSLGQKQPGNNNNFAVRVTHASTRSW